MTTSRFFLQVLSYPELRSEESESSLLSAGKPLALLCYLALATEPVPRDDLAAMLWPEADRTRARASLRQAVWTLRKLLGDTAFTSDDPMRLSDDLLRVDLDQLKEALNRGDLDEAVRLWIGPPLQGLEFPKATEWRFWVDELRSKEEERLATALVAGAGGRVPNGEAERAIQWLEHAVRVETHSFSHRRALIEALLSPRLLAKAAAAITDARKAFEDEESRGTLEEYEERLSHLLTNGMEANEPPALQPAFVGRAAEFSVLAGHWREVAHGKARVALITGTPGIGKTRLAEEVARLAHSEDALVVSAKAVESERSLKWGLVSDLVRSLYPLPGAAGITSRSFGVLAHLVPSLAHIGTKSASPASLFPLEPAAIKDALLDLAAAVAEDGPLVVFVDDLQWVDERSMATLSYLIRALAARPVFFLLTCRDGEESNEVRKILASVEELTGDGTITLGPLSQPEVSELLTLLLDPLEPEVFDQLGRELFGITQGNPLFIVEILKLLQEDGLLQSNGSGKWAVVPQALRPPPAPSRIRRIGHLAPA